MTDEVENDILLTNSAFYRAMRQGDFRSMEDLWARHRKVSCIHPGHPALVGREDVMDSFKLILRHNPPEIFPDEPTVIVTGKTALVLLIERIEGLSLIATNGFVLEEGKWRMMSHQAADSPLEAAE